MVFQIIYKKICLINNNLRFYNLKYKYIKQETRKNIAYWKKINYKLSKTNCLSFISLSKIIKLLFIQVSSLFITLQIKILCIFIIWFNICRSLLGKKITKWKFLDNYCNGFFCNYLVFKYIYFNIKWTTWVKLYK